MISRLSGHGGDWDNKFTTHGQVEVIANRFLGGEVPDKDVPLLDNETFSTALVLWFSDEAGHRDLRTYQQLEYGRGHKQVEAFKDRQEFNETSQNGIRPRLRICRG